jgi:hypothetical protein
MPGRTSEKVKAWYRARRFFRDKKNIQVPAGKPRPLNIQPRQDPTTQEIATTFDQKGSFQLQNTPASLILVHQQPTNAALVPVLEPALAQVAGMKADSAETLLLLRLQHHQQKISSRQGSVNTLTQQVLRQQLQPQSAIPPVIPQVKSDGISQHGQAQPIMTQQAQFLAGTYRLAAGAGPEAQLPSLARLLPILRQHAASTSCDEGRLAIPALEPDVDAEFSPPAFVCY